MHAEAKHEAGAIVVYLIPGLTSAQRTAALRRLRQEGSRGCGPRLPVGWLALALVADRLRLGLRSTAGAVRLHPVGTLLPALLAGSLLGGFLFASMYGQVETASPRAVPGGAASWAVPAGSRAASPLPGEPPQARMAGQAGIPGFPSERAATVKALPTP